MISLCLLSTMQALAGRGFAIVVDKKSYNEAKNEIQAYAKAIEDMQHLHVYTVIDRWGVPDSIRTELQRLHALRQNPIEGAVFIGDIPIAMIRDAQHFTSAFKMNQKANRKQSSIPSDRYYDDFNLKFKPLGHDNDAPYYYYSLTAESPQILNPTLYSGRIRPTDVGGTSRYVKLRNYLTKVVREKRAAGSLNKMFYFEGHGYISQSFVARVDEKEGLYEHFPWLKRQPNGISYLSHLQYRNVKFKLMNELMRQDLDFAILHHHGAWNTEYLNGIPSPNNVNEAKTFIQQFFRNKTRDAKDRGQNADSVMAAFEKRLDIPHTWLENTFDPKIVAKDSLDNDLLDLHTTDFAKYNYTPNCRVIMIDACFNGSFHREDCIADEYIFSPGRTVAVIANTVNVLQNKWSDRYMGLLGLGASVGELARFSYYMESHVIGDPTFTFIPSQKSADISALLAGNNDAAWRKLLKTDAHADVKCIAIDRLNRDNKMTSAELLAIFRNSDEALVRLQALYSLAEHDDANFIEALKLAANDSYELVQRTALHLIGESGNDALIPTIIAANMTNSLSERCRFNAMNALTLFPKDKLLAEFQRQFNAPSLRLIDKEKTGKRYEKLIVAATEKWGEYVDMAVSPNTTAKKRLSAIRGLRNYCPHHRIPEILNYLRTQAQPDAQVALLEMLGWHTLSYQVPAIDKCADEMSRDNSLKPEVRNEALKTVNRLKHINK